MAGIATQFLIAPIKGEKAFQDFCLELARLEWNDSDAELHGRQGQNQNGVDITGTDKAQNRGRAGMQCKGSESNTPRALSVEDFDKEVEKAKTLHPKLGVYIVAFTGPRDQAITNRAAEYREEHKTSGLFEVYAWSWDEITERASTHPDLVERLRLMVWPDQEVRPALTPKRPDGNTQLELLKNQLQAIAETVRYIDESPKADLADAASNAKIDLLRDLIRTGNSEAAKGQLETFISTLGPETSDRVWFRAYANLGAAYIGTSQLEQAAEAFDNAAAKGGETADGLSYRARAAQARHDDAQCYTYAKAALALDPANILSANLLIESAPDEVKTADIEAMMVAIRTNGDVGWALSRRYSEEGLSEDALRCATELIEDPPWIRPVAVGDALLNTFNDDLKARMGVPTPPEQRARIEQAVVEYERAWTIIKARRDRTLWVHAAMNLNAAYRIAGRVEEADALALEAYSWAPEVQVVQMRAALAYLHTNDFGKAQTIAEKLAETKPDSALFVAHMCAAAKDFPSTLEWATKALEATEGLDKLRSAELLVLALEHTDTAEAALAKALELEKKLGTAPSFLARIAELARRALAEPVLERVRADLDSFALASLDPLERFELGEAYADDEQWSKAADAIEGLYALDQSSVLLRRHLYALLQADRRQDSRSLFESLTPAVRASKGVSRLGAAIYERSGLIKEAIDQLVAALKVDPEDIRTRLDWVRLNLRDGKEDSVRKWVRVADPNPIADADDLMELAQVLSKFGRRQEALTLGYKTLRAAWGTSETAHVKYASLFLLQGTKKEPWLSPKAVGIDTEVKLKRENGEDGLYRIEDGPPMSGRIAPSHPLAVALIGKKKGDRVTLAEGIGESVEWTVREIKHVYVALFHEVLREHGVLFPGNRSFGMFSVNTDSPQAFEPLLDSLRERARTGQEVLDLYKTAEIPVDFVAEVMGADVLDVVDALRWKADLTLDTCRGNSQERNLAVTTSSETTKILVDYLTLNLWDEVGLLETLQGLGVTIQIVQATIDESTLRIEKARLALGERGGFMAAVGERFQYTEIPASVRQEHVDTVEGRLRRIRALVEIVPTESWAPGATPEEIHNVLSSSSQNTISTAVATSTPLVCEDRRLRTLATEFGVLKSTWTQPLLLSLVAKGALSKLNYAQIIAKLYDRRIGFVSVDALDLIAATIAGDEATLDSLLKCLTAPTVDPISLSDVAEGFLSALWLQVAFKVRREYFSSRLFENLLINRKGDSLGIISKIYGDVSNVFMRLPFASRMISLFFKDYITGFIKGHFLPVSD